MASPQQKTKQQPSAVANCTVTNCKFNEDKECHAGEIEVRMDANGASCATYSPEGGTRPRP